MIKIAIVTLSSVLSTAALAASSVYRFDAETINSSVKCELATVARMMAREKIPATRLIATVAINGTEITNRKVGANFNIPFLNALSGTASYTTEETQLRGATGDRNINAKNAINCRKSFIIDVGILSCFKEQKELFVEGNTITCSEERKATSTLDGKGGFSIWTIDVGPSGSLSKTRTWKIAVTAPPEKKK